MKIPKCYVIIGLYYKSLKKIYFSNDTNEQNTAV